MRTAIRGAGTRAIDEVADERQQVVEVHPCMPGRTPQDRGSPFEFGEGGRRVVAPCRDARERV